MVKNRKELAVTHSCAGHSDDATQVHRPFNRMRIRSDRRKKGKWWRALGVLANQVHLSGGFLVLFVTKLSLSENFVEWELWNSGAGLVSERWGPGS